MDKRTKPDTGAAEGETVAAPAGTDWQTSLGNLLLSRTWLLRVLVAAGLLGLFLVYFWRVVFLGRTLLPTDHLFYYDPVWRSYAVEGGRASNHRQIDIVAQFYPYMAFNHDAIKEGVFPLWNPYYLTGHPYYAGFQPAILFPLNWFFFWDPKAAWGLTAIIRLWLAALFTYAYLREMRLGTLGSLVGALAFSLSGYFVVRLHYTMANALMLLPLLLLLTERMIKRPRLLWVPLAAGVFGVQFLAGHPETSFSLGAVWGLYAIYRLANAARDAGSLRPAVWPGILLALSAAIGVTLAAVQLIPFLDLLQDSATMKNRLDVFAGDWSPSPPVAQLGRHLLAGANLLLPNFFGTPLDNNWWTPLLETDNYVFKINYLTQTRYLGLISLWLAGVGLFARWRNRPVPFFGILALSSLLLDLRLPVIVLYTVPPLRFAGGTLPPSVFVTGTAVLAGFGADTLARNRGSVSKRAWVGLVVLCLVTLAVALAMYFAVDTWNVDQLLQGRKGHRAMLRLYHPFSWRLYFPLAFGLAAVALFWADRRRWLKKPVTMAILVLLVAGELYAFGWDYNPTLPPEQVFPETAATRFLREQAGLQRVSGLTLALKPNSSLVLGLYAIDGYEDLVSSRYLRFVGRNMQAWTREDDSLVLEETAERLLDLTSTRYIVIPRLHLLDEAGSEYPQVFQDEYVSVFENVDTLPRAYVVREAEVVSGGEASLARVYASDFDPRRSVVLDSDSMAVMPAGDQRETAPEPGEGGTGDDSVEIVQYGFHDVAVTAHLGQDGYLVLTDGFDPDWQASVDGQAVPLLRANDVFRAVALSAGEHTVTFHYSPRAVRVGLYVTLAGLAILASICLVALASSRRRVSWPDMAEGDG